MEPVSHRAARPLAWVAWLALAAAAAGAPHRAQAQSICESCEVQTGLGATYHFWGPTGGVVLPVTLNWSDNRYELGLFRVATTQLLKDHAYREPRVMADPYWGMSLSRRWTLIERGPVSGFVGLGLAAKTESDQLSATRIDFAEQLGVRFRLPGDRVRGEVTLRHWSNAGIRLPNHGQDFATLTFRLNTRWFGVPRADLIAIDPSFDLARAPPPATAAAGTASAFRGQITAALSSPGDLP
jgi:Lipid A 3-O-deacylase (PagL)